MKNLYEILDVSPDADDSEIKKAYRKKAQAYHPDKKGGDEELFKEVQKAYDILSDANKREYYNQTGAEKNEPPNTLVLESLFAIVFNIVQNSNVKNLNIVDVTRNFLANQQKTHLANKENLDRQKFNLTEAAERITIAEGKENALKSALLHQSRQLEIAIQQVEDMIKVGEQIIKILDDYEYKVDSAPQSFYSPFGAFHTSASTLR